jgi:DNA-binding transcriptional ArsR family regulator
VLDLELIDDPVVAVAALDPARTQMLAVLNEPGSATTVATALGIPRQKANYHLRVLESHGLIHLVEERPRHGLTERIMQATAKAYVVSPSALGDRGSDPERTDRLSSRYLIAIGARLVREVAALARGADAAGKSLPTMSIDTDIRFASAADRAQFTDDLTSAVKALAAKYHDESTPGGRWHRVIVAAHPRPPHSQPTHPAT